MRYCEVIVDLSAEAVDRLFTYAVPDGMDVDAGWQVEVPFGPRSLEGFVVTMKDECELPPEKVKCVRRTVRDYETRGSSVQHTLSMWDSVRRGEHRWIFPYQENADVIFNSSTLYELAVLKRHIFPLLTAVQPEDDCYEEVRSIVKVLNYIREADVDDEIPPTSLVREFIGGNSFYR